MLPFSQSGSLSERTSVGHTSLPHLEPLLCFPEADFSESPHTRSELSILE